LNLRRILLPFALLAGVLVVPATSQAALYGFSEQQASMFDHPLYKDLRKVKVARYIAPWDVASDSRDRAIWEAWLAGAKRDNQRVLVSFYYDRDNPMKLPSVKQYEKAMKAFKKAYGSKVESISPYNEANRDASKQNRFRGPSPRQAAQYYEVARKVFKGKKIVGLDLLDQNNVKPSIKYLKSFKRYVKVQPKIWGLHNYSDTNRNSSKRTKAVLAATKGEVWLTETGGLVKLGTSFPHNQARAAKALRFMFKLAKSNPRLKRLYIYQWTGANPDDVFDAGLVNPDGSKRPGYDVVKSHLG
jgi:hypothetical protein